MTTTSWACPACTKPDHRKAPDHTFDVGCRYAVPVTCVIDATDDRRIDQMVALGGRHAGCTDYTAGGEHDMLACDQAEALRMESVRRGGCGRVILANRFALDVCEIGAQCSECRLAADDRDRAIRGQREEMRELDHAAALVEHVERQFDAGADVALVVSRFSLLHITREGGGYKVGNLRFRTVAGALGISCGIAPTSIEDRARAKAYASAAARGFGPRIAS
jgi:hypothetical protein